MSSKSEINFEPGAAKYGNFIDYYKFNPSCKRIELLSCDFWQLLKSNEPNVTCLDVGCNTGELTSVLFEKLSSEINADGLKTVHMIGVDLDEILILRAVETVNNQHISFICEDVACDSFPDTVSGLLQQYSCNKFHVISMFSVTMWIHLNRGDDGLRDVIYNLSKLCNFMLLEVQPWKCYRTALRRMRKFKQDHFPEFEKLQMRENIEDDLDRYLVNKCQMKKVYESMSSHWGRKIKLYANTVLFPS